MAPWLAGRRQLTKGAVRCSLLAAAVALVATLTAAAASAATITNLHVAPGTNALLEVACSSATSCLATGYGPGGGVVVPITNGTPGAAQVVPVRLLASVACSSATSCLLVGTESVIRPGQRPGTRGVVVPVTNGIVGSPLGVPDTQALSHVACASATTCYASGSAPTTGAGLLVTLTNGVPGAIQPTPGYDIASLTCSTATTCYAVGSTADQGVVVSITNGIPGPPQVAPGTSSLNGVGCSGPVTCFAVGSSSEEDSFQPVLVPILNGVPGAPQVVSDVAAVPDIACLSATTCEAVGFNDAGAVVVPVVNGKPGSVVAVPGSTPGDGFFGVACASAATCVAVGANSSQQGIVGLINEPPSSASDCKNNGWRNFRTPVFASQGDCVSYVQAAARCRRLTPRQPLPGDAGSQQFQHWFQLFSGCLHPPAGR